MVSAPLPSSPTRLRPADLLHATDRYADDVLCGRYDHLLPPAVRRATTAGSPACTATTNSTSG